MKFEKEYTYYIFKDISEKTTGMFNSPSAGNILVADSKKKRTSKERALRDIKCIQYTYQSIHG